MVLFQAENNEDYVTHIIAMHHLLEQKKSEEDRSKAFEVFTFLKSGDTVGKLPAGRALVTNKEQKTCTIYRGTQYKNPIMTKLV